MRTITMMSKIRDMCRTKPRRGTLAAALLTCALALLPSSARASVFLDLTPTPVAPDSGETINGAIYNQGAVLAGTGVFPSFVQITNSGGPGGSKEGYNTTVNNVLNNGSADEHNFAIKVSDLPIFTDPNTGKQYYSFFLDINEANNDTDKFLSLDELKIITSNTPNQSVQGVPSGTVQYDMQSGVDGSGNIVFLNFDNFEGSGKADLEVLIPVFSTTDTYVYLYSKFGSVGVLGTSNQYDVPAGDYGISDGFEEWALGRSDAGPPQTVPGPAGLLLGFAGAGSFGGFAGLSWLRRRLGRK
jgi:hypothetical protein